MSQPGWLSAWRRFDAALQRATEVALFAIGAVFTVAVTAEVASRFAFEFSIYFVNALALLLLVWFFVIGAGLALRRGAHVGFDLVVNSLPATLRRLVVLVADLLVLAFFVLMLVSGIYTLGPAAEQIEHSMGVSVLWAMLAFPIGFSLLIYHQLALMLERRCRTAP